MSLLRRLLPLLLLLAVPGRPAAAEKDGVFAKANLAAWCIVPFDGARRGPEARAAMLAELGLTKLVYDYRAEHIPQWDDELKALKKHNITLLGWWFPGTLNDEARQTLELFKRHDVRPQLWIMGSGGPLEVRDAADQEARIAAEVKRFAPLAEAAAGAGCTVGIYNHGGWSGEPENAVAVVESLKAAGLSNVGIVYNLHHGHAHLDRLETVLPRLLPHLLCFNLNGMEPDGEATGRKIMPVGAGSRDLGVLRLLRSTGYTGPVGILNHTDEDAKARLLDNLDGLSWLLPQMDDLPPGPPPQWRTWNPAPKEPDTEPEPPASRTSSFSPDRAPLREEDNRHWKAFVNRERIFDFYSKQARHFLAQPPPRPDLLAVYPGLDSGLHGHWGNQTDAETWKDDRFARSDLGPIFSTVFRGPDLTVPKGICVRSENLSGCFNPLTLSFAATWKDGFLKLTDARHGFMGGGKMEGNPVDVMPGTPLQPGDAWHGFYRHGREVIFSFTRGGVRTLAALDPARTTAVLELLTHGGPAQWPEWITTRGTLGREEPFATDTISLPFNNPWGTLFFLTAHDFFPDGTAAVSTMTGEIWLIRGLDDRLENVRWKRFATGLHQPLGLKISGNAVHVLGRDQITRLHDLNGDDEADFYECVSNIMTTSPGGHDYIIGLEQDREGRFYFGSGNQGLCRITLPDKIEVLATGLRNPNGTGLSPDGKFVTTSVQEGDWTPASAVCLVPADPAAGREPPHFGAGGPRRQETPASPLLWLPRGEDNSASSQAFLSEKAWPGLQGRGNFIHLSSGTGSAWLVMPQEVDGQWQGAAVKLTGNFDSGAQCARFHPGDGHLYVTGLQGWGSYTPADGCFQRVRFNPASSLAIPIGFEARGNGVLLHFDRPPDPLAATDAAQHFAQSWHYRRSAAYGSPELSGRSPGVPGHDPLDIRSARVLDGGKSLFLEIPDLAPAGQIHLHVAVGGGRSHDLFLTVHAQAADFTDFPGYTASSARTAPQNPAAPEAVLSIPNPWAQGPAGRAVRSDAAEGLRYVQQELSAKRGERLSLTFSNPDTVPHNWVLARPGTLEAMGGLTNRMISDPQGLARHYVPDSPDILVWTDMTSPGGRSTIHFDVPPDPGDYPFFCSFPGHWMVMHGVLRVE